MKATNPRAISRRSLLAKAAASVATASLMDCATPTSASVLEGPGPVKNECEGEILGQDNFRYRARRRWGLLDRSRYPVKDCHGMAEDRKGRIVLLTNDTHNNLIAYDKSGKFLVAWETRFPTAHGLDIEDHRGEDRYWITDHDLQCLSVCSADGREMRRIGPEAVASRYPSLKDYHPTNSALAPDGDFFISDGYGSSFVHHFDPEGQYISSFGGTGNQPSNLNEPHAVWMDTRSGKPSVLVCDRGNEMLKWFSLSGELQRIVPVPGARPSNIAPFHGSPGGRFDKHIAVASLNGMILILDEKDLVVSVVGGEPPVYIDGKLKSLQVFNYTFNHPHDVYVDRAGALYVPQWWSNQSYPIKLEPLIARD
jgi:peptidylamidoglycolate lyase